MTRAALLQVDSLNKRFGGVVAADALEMTVAPAEIVGLVGPNGSGKSTTLNLISGAVKPDAGSVRFEGADVTALAPEKRVRRRIARTFQLVRIIDGLSVRDNVAAGFAFGADPLPMPTARREAERLIAEVGLDGRAEQDAGSLTYIDQKRVELARALATGPRLLLLDEWLSGLNPTELTEGIALIRRVAAQGIAVILVEHVMSAVRALCTRVVVMNAGAKIAEGCPDDALSDPEVVRAYLGDDDA